VSENKSVNTIDHNILKRHGFTRMNTDSEKIGFRNPCHIKSVKISVNPCLKNNSGSIIDHDSKKTQIYTDEHGFQEYWIYGSVEMLMQHA
jgi:hypothetical protein